MTIMKFLVEVMVCIGVCIKKCVAITLSKWFSKNVAINNDPAIKLTAMSYNKAGDLNKLSDKVDPQCKCDLRG